MATEKSTKSRTTKKSTGGSGSETSGKQGSAKKPAKASSARKRSSSEGPSSARKGPSSEGASKQKKSSAAEVAQRAAAQLGDLTGRQVEGVTSFERTEEGWKVEIDVLELRRIPSTTDVLATYEVDVDSQGELQGYRRAHRYVRGVAGEE